MENEQENSKKPFWKKWWVWVIAVIVVIAIANSPSDSNKSGNTPATQTTGESKQETTETNQTTETKEETPVQSPVEKPKPKKWIKVIELSGNANKRSDLFKLTGEKARLTYDVKGSMVVVGIYVMEEGKQILKEGGLPEVTVNQAGKDSTILMKDPGNYYLDVQAANATWTVLIEEFK